MREYYKEEENEQEAEVLGTASGTRAGLNHTFMAQVKINSAISSDRLCSVGGAVREQMAGARGRPAVRGWCLGVQGHDCARAWRGVSFNGLKQACCRGAGFALLCSRRMQRGWRLWRWEEEARCALSCGSENILCSLYYSSMSSC